jgi:hypothetical protein
MNINDLPEDVLSHIFKQGCILHPLVIQTNEGYSWTLVGRKRNPFVALLRQVCSRWNMLTGLRAYASDYWYSTLVLDLSIWTHGCDESLMRFQESLASVNDMPCELHLVLILSNRRPDIFRQEPDFTDMLLCAFTKKAEQAFTRFLNATMQLFPVADRIRSLFLSAPSLAFPRFIFPFLAALEGKAPLLEVLHLRAVELSNHDDPGSRSYELPSDSTYNLPLSVFELNGSPQSALKPQQSLTCAGFPWMTEMLLSYHDRFPADFPLYLKKFVYCSKKTNVPWNAVKTLFRTCVHLSVVTLIVCEVKVNPEDQQIVHAPCTASVVNLTLDIISGIENVIPILFSTFNFPHLHDLCIGRLITVFESANSEFLIPNLANFTLEVLSPAPLSVLEAFFLPSLQQFIVKDLSKYEDGSAISQPAAYRIPTTTAPSSTKIEFATSQFFHDTLSQFRLDEVTSLELDSDYYPEKDLPVAGAKQYNLPRLRCLTISSSSQVPPIQVEGESGDFLSPLRVPGIQELVLRGLYSVIPALPGPEDLARLRKLTVTERLLKDFMMDFTNLFRDSNIEHLVITTCYSAESLRDLHPSAVIEGVLIWPRLLVLMVDVESPEALKEIDEALVDLVKLRRECGCSTFAGTARLYGGAPYLSTFLFR